MVPPSTNAKWKDLVTGKTQYQFNLLGLRILMGRILLSTRTDPSLSNVNQAVEEIRDFFVKNEKIATQDLNKIFG